MFKLYDCTFSSQGRRYPGTFPTREAALATMRRESANAEYGGAWDFAVYDIREEMPEVSESSAL